ncbi:MAG TPA: SoxR reducing system RseC family protein [Thermoanaerobacterales bacterium]|nr:SoxR reducing system RseC family protein [Thermoanaerobacterales bacterium]
MKALGKVVEILDNGTAKIQIIRHSACSKCHACSIGDEKIIFIEALNLINAKEGETVEIGFPKNSFLTAVLVAYFIPLIGFVSGIFLGKIIAGLFNLRLEDLFSVLIGILLMMEVYLIANSLNTRINNKKMSTPIILGIDKNSY